MNKTNNLGAPLRRHNATSLKCNLKGNTKDYFSSIKGNLSFFQIKNLLRTPVLENISIEGHLIANGTFIIYFNEQEFIKIPAKLDEQLGNTIGLEIIFLPKSLFFKGSLMDGFKYDHLSEEISTYILNGNVVPMNNNDRTSTIGRLKRVEDIIHLNSSLIINNLNKNSDKANTNQKVHLGFDISMQFKQKVA